MPPLFFFSYARDDSANSGKLRQFFKDLETEVRKRSGFGQEAGFFDTSDIKAGAPWSDTLAKALCEARVFVSLLSPTYVTREFCGKELQVFTERWHAYSKSLKDPLACPPAILPVVWIPLRREAPAVLAPMQWHDDSLPEEYRQEGLEYLMRLRTKRDQYQKFLIELANKIIDGAEKNALSPLEVLRPFDEIPSAFHVVPGKPVTSPVATLVESGGPKSAQFIFVAARRDEIAAVRQGLESYDDGSAWHWKPFHPHEDTIGIFAQEAALKQRIRYGEVPIGKDLKERLEQARQDNSIVIVLLDAWTLKVEPYRMWVTPYDKVSLPNCALLIPWNEGDEETVGHRKHLEDHLSVVLPAKSLSKPSLFFRDAIVSVEDLRSALADTLAQIQMKILEVGEAKKRIEAAVLSSPPAIPVPGAQLP